MTRSLLQAAWLSAGLIGAFLLAWDPEGFLGLLLFAAFLEAWRRLHAGDPGGGLPGLDAFITADPRPGMP